MFTEPVVSKSHSHVRCKGLFSGYLSSNRRMLPYLPCNNKRVLWPVLGLAQNLPRNDPEPPLKTIFERFKNGFGSSSGPGPELASNPLLTHFSGVEKCFKKGFGASFDAGLGCPWRVLVLVWSRLIVGGFGRQGEHPYS